VGWLGNPFWCVQTLAALFRVGLVALIFWELRAPNRWSISDHLAERNFACCCIIIFCAYAVPVAEKATRIGGE
jgi:MFS transporter, DHA2 family, multidrug resistance protein